MHEQDDQTDTAISGLAALAEAMADTALCTRASKDREKKRPQKPVQMVFTNHAAAVDTAPAAFGRAVADNGRWHCGADSDDGSRQRATTRRMERC